MLSLQASHVPMTVGLSSVTPSATLSTSLTASTIPVRAFAVGRRNRVGSDNMGLNKHIDTIQLPEGNLRVVQDSGDSQVKVFHSMKPEPLAVFGIEEPAEHPDNVKVARHQAIEYANGYAHGLKED